MSRLFGSEVCGCKVEGCGEIGFETVLRILVAAVAHKVMVVELDFCE